MVVRQPHSPQSCQGPLVMEKQEQFFTHRTESPFFGVTVISECLGTTLPSKIVLKKTNPGASKSIYRLWFS